MSRPRHPNAHIESAIVYAEALGWRVTLSNGHAWGHLLCPEQSRAGCMIAIWSTPRAPEKHARQVRKKIDACPHRIGVRPDDAEEDSA